MSEIVYLPEEIKVTKVQYIKAVNAILPDEPEVKHYNSYNPKEFDLDEWLRKYGIGFQKVQAGSSTKYILDKCPFDDNHKGKDACLFVSANGAIGFHCFHNSCADKKWQDVRKLYEPDAYEKKQEQTDDLLYGHFNTGKVKHIEPIPEGGAAFLNAMDILNIEEPEEEFIPTGIYWIDKKMRGLKKTGVSVVSGSRGASKSTLLTQMCANVVDAGYKVAMYSGEMKNKNLCRLPVRPASKLHNTTTIMWYPRKTRKSLRNGWAIISGCTITNMVTIAPALLTSWNRLSRINRLT